MKSDILKHEKRLQAAAEEMERRGIRPWGRNDR